MSNIDPGEIALRATKFERELIKQLKADGLEPTGCSQWVAAQLNVKVAELQAEGDHNELVYEVIDTVQTSLDSYIAQNEAVTKKLFDKVRELEDRISYLETRGE